MRSTKPAIAAGALSLWALLCAAVSGYGEDVTWGQEEPQVVTGRLYMDRETVVPGSDLRIVLEAYIDEDYHINSHTPGDEFLIPAEIRIDGVEGFTFDLVIYPPALQKTYEFSDEALSVYEGTVLFGIAGRTAAHVQPGEHQVNVVFSYQPCDHIACYPPEDVTFPLSVTVVPLGQDMRPANEDVMARVVWGGPAGTDGQGDDFAALVRERGLLLALLIVFVGGLALNLTPCVFPIIPITVSFFTSQSGGRSSRAFQLALAYFLGITLCFSVLGTVAALTGSLFGVLLQSPVVLIFIAGVLIYLALSMFGLYEIPLFTKLQSTTGGAKKGLAGAFLMGLTVGLAASPCIGPFVLGLLVFVGNTGSPLVGFVVFFTLAAGLGLPYLILGTFSGMLSALPRAGTWMEAVKKILAVILFGLVFYFLRPLMPAGTYRYVFAGYLIVGGIVLFAVRTGGEPKGLRMARHVVAAAFVVWGLFSFYNAVHIRERAGLRWATVSSMSQLDEALASGKAVIVHFTATWCAVCHELEDKTYVDPAVVAASRNFLLLQVDLSKEDEGKREIREQLNIRGCPTVLFFDSSGQEHVQIRQSGFVGPERFLELMKSLSP